MATLAIYGGLEALKRRLGITDADDDDDLTDVLEAASRLVDEYCDDYFGQVTATNYYTAYSGESMMVDSYVSLSAVLTDNDGDAVYETTWATTDYITEPRNAATLNKPYTSLRRTQPGNYYFPLNFAPDGVKLTGVFGWPKVPGPVNEVALLEAARAWTQSKAPSGVISNAAGGSNTITPELHPTSKVMLHKYVSEKLRMA